jgi:NTP pyrophosphatase (non-canonical NTP hydrolase)
LSRAEIFHEITNERRRQDQLFGVQDHADGTGHPDYVNAAHTARLTVATLNSFGAITWLSVLTEEVCEAFAETDPDKLREELIQVAAVAVAWAEAIDRRNTPEELVKITEAHTCRECSDSWQEPVSVLASLAQSQPNVTHMHCNSHAKRDNGSEVPGKAPSP